MKAILRNIRISPKKANLIAGMVREKKVKEALDILKFTPKKGARIIYKVVKSAASNAKNNFKQSIEDLVITRILVTKGPTFKRSLPVSRGRTHPILKRTSHITVDVGLAEGDVSTAKEESANSKADIKKEKMANKKEVKKNIKKSDTDSKKIKLVKKEAKQTEKSDK